MMMKGNGLSKLAWILLIIGGLNWGLVGLLNWNLVGAIFGDMTVVSKIIYDLVGLSALYLLFGMGMKKS